MDNSVISHLIVRPQSRRYYLLVSLRRPLFFNMLLALVLSWSTLGYAEQWLPQDWVPLSELSDDQKQQCRVGCRGVYVEPDYQQSGNDLTIEADEKLIDTKQYSARVQGNVLVSQGDRRITAAGGHFDQRNGAATLTGKVTLRDIGVLIEGDNLSLGSDNRVSMNNARILLHDQRIISTGKAVERSHDGHIHIDKASYTQCEADRQYWQVQASKIHLNPDKGYGESTNAVLKVLGVPILYTPYLRFPIDDRSQTGLLYPILSFDSDNGLDVTQPFFWSIAPNIDVTLAPRWIENRGFGVDVENRWLTRNSLTNISGSYLFDDKGGDDLIRPNTFADTDRWLASVQHQSRIKRISTYIDYTQVSDFDYFEDIPINVLNVGVESFDTAITQSAGVAYNSSNWQVGVNLLRYQRVFLQGNEQYRQLPNAYLNANIPLFAGFELDIQQQYAYFDHPDNTRITGQRQRLDYQIRYRKDWSWGYVNSAGGIKNLLYQLQENTANAPTQQNIHVPVASFDAGLIFERSAGKRLIQTFEPRVFYSYSGESANNLRQNQLPVFDTNLATFNYQQLFRDNRYIGFDRIGDSRQLSIGLSTGFIDTKQGYERLRLSVGQSYFFQDRQVNFGLSSEQLQTSKSDIALQMDVAINKNWRLIGETQWQPTTEQLTGGNIILSYRGNKSQHSTLFSLSHAYQRSANVTMADTQQSKLSLYWPITRGWQGFTVWEYDFERERNLNANVGMRYQNCCWNIDVMWFQHIQSDSLNTNIDNFDRGVLVQFQLTGLGSFGKDFDSVLQRLIFGYTERP